MRALGVAAAIAAAGSIVLGAGAANRVGTQRADVLRGTQRADTIRALAGGDFVDGRAGRDRIDAGTGDDRVKAQDHAADTVACGLGADVVTADAADLVAADCELVSRRISRDRFRRSVAGQHETQVEPHSAAFGATIVATFQVGRIADGGAAALGWATSTDGGATWRSGLVPGLTRATRPAGLAARASDPVVAYDAVHGTWLIASLVLGGDGSSALGISRSPDGVAWGPPAVAASSSRFAFDKEWLACDNWPESRFRGRCYLAYTAVEGEDGPLRLLVSSDGGLTWSEPVSLGADGSGALPLVLPSGDLVVGYLGAQIRAVVSHDGGATFTDAARVGPARYDPSPLLRSPQLPTGAVGGDGTAYLAWHACTGVCNAADVMLTRSRDGLDWSPATRVPTGARGPRYVLPALAADATGDDLALTFHRLRGRQLDVLFSSSPDGGATWARPRRLNAERMSVSWIAETTAGPMVGDYLGTTLAGGVAVPVYALGARPGPRFDQSIFAARIPVS